VGELHGFSPSEVKIFLSFFLAILLSCNLASKQYTPVPGRAKKKDNGPSRGLPVIAFAFT
jgi:hypothetical protein